MVEKNKVAFNLETMKAKPSVNARDNYGNGAKGRKRILPRQTAPNHFQTRRFKQQTVFAFQENPYVMLRQNHQDLEGNDRYEGFCVDMLKELADILKFKYRIRLVGDGHYGVPGTNGTWTGMVGELISRVG